MCVWHFLIIIVLVPFQGIHRHITPRAFSFLRPPICFPVPSSMPMYLPRTPVPWCRLRLNISMCVWHCLIIIVGPISAVSRHPQTYHATSRLIRKGYRQRITMHTAHTSPKAWPPKCLISGVTRHTRDGVTSREKPLLASGLNTPNAIESCAQPLFIFSTPFCRGEPGHSSLSCTATFVMFPIPPAVVGLFSPLFFFLCFP